MKKILIICAAALLIGVGFIAKSAIDKFNKPQTPEEIEQELMADCNKLIDAEIAVISGNMIFVPSNFFNDLSPKKLEIQPIPPEEGWVLFSLTKEGKLLKEVEIPASVEDKPVVGLFSGAFFLCPNLVSVTIPDTICFAFNNAFLDCPKLKSITSSAAFFDAVGGVNSPIFVDCHISEWNYSGDGLEVEFGFVPIE